jgi:hypothetical protein
VTKGTATIIGFITAPLVVAVTGVVLTPPAMKDAVSMFGFGGFFYFIAALVTMILGVPSFLVLTRLKRITWWSTTVIGAAIGALAGIVYYSPNSAAIGGLLSMAAMGAASAFVFWLIWRQGREDAPNSTLQS